MRLQLVLHIAGVVVSESCECVCYIQKNLQVYLAVDVVPIEIQPQVSFPLPIAGYFIALFEN